MRCADTWPNGIVAPQGIARVGELVAVLMGEPDARVPKLARLALRGITCALERLDQQIEAAILAWHKGNEVGQRLAAIPGIGPITASAIVATLTAPAHFRSDRQFADWIGLVLQQNSSGGEHRQSGIGKPGGRTLRRFSFWG